MFQRSSSTEFTLRFHDTLWHNFSSKTDRKPFDKLNTTNDNNVNKLGDTSNIAEPEKQTIEQILTGTHDLERKMLHLLSGNFEINENTKPIYHVLGSFTGGGASSILLFPTFTQEDIKKFLKTKELSRPKIPGIEKKEEIDYNLIYNIPGKDSASELVTLGEQLTKQALVKTSEPEIISEPTETTTHEVALEGRNEVVTEPENYFAREYFNGNLSKKMLLRHWRTSPLFQEHRIFTDVPDSLQHRHRMSKEYRKNLENNINDRYLIKNLTLIFDVLNL